MITIRYEDMKFHYITHHYDVHWGGTCWYNGKLAKFHTVDKTDYQLMNDTCPSCKDGGTDDCKDCHCTSYPDLECVIEELSFIDRIKTHISVQWHRTWYIRQWGWRGFGYFNNWYYGKNK